MPGADKWLEQTWDQVRKLLEESDSVASFNFLTTYDPSCGLTAALAEEVGNECKSALTVASLLCGKTSSRMGDPEGRAGDANRASREEFRRVVNAGVSLAGLNETCDAVIPLDLKMCEDLLEKALGWSAGSSSSSKREETGGGVGTVRRSPTRKRSLTSSLPPRLQPWLWTRISCQLGLRKLTVAAGFP